MTWNLRPIARGGGLVKPHFSMRGWGHCLGQRAPDLQLALAGLRCMLSFSICYHAVPASSESQPKVFHADDVYPSIAVGNVEQTTPSLMSPRLSSSLPPPRSPHVTLFLESRTPHGKSWLRARSLQLLQLAIPV